MTNRPNKVFIISANEGCKHNLMLCNQVARYSTYNEHELTTDAREADVLIVSCCSYSVQTEAISLEHMRQALRDKKPDARVAATGCIAAIDGNSIAALSGQVTFLRESGQMDDLLYRSRRYRDCASYYLDYQASQLYRRHEEDAYLTKRFMLWLGRTVEKRMQGKNSPRLHRAGIHHILDEFALRRMVYVQIGSGCAHHCAYCIIKKNKGDPHSRKIAEIMPDVRKVYSPGKILSLFMDDCGSFGMDTGETLFDLVAAIHQELPEFPIDLSYVHPRWLETFADRYIEMFASHAVKSVNISMQSGSDAVIERMRRFYHVAEVLKVVQAIKKVSPQTFVWTHFITGLPGETWSEFRDSIRASKAFDFYFCFAFSSRAGTMAATMNGRVPVPIKYVRRSMLHSLIAARLLAKLLGPL